MKKYVKIVLMVVITIQLEELSAMNWWPTSFSWGGSSSQTINNNNQQTERRIQPIIAKAAKLMQAYEKRTEDLSFKENRYPKICWVLAGRDNQAFETGQAIKAEIFSSIEGQKWQDTNNHNTNIREAFGLIHDTLCQTIHPSKGLSLIVAVILESKIIVAHAGIAGFVLKKDKKKPLFSQQHHLDLNNNEITRLIDLKASILKYSMLPQFLPPCKIRHDHNHDSNTIYYPEWNYSYVFEEYDTSTENHKMPRKKCESPKKEILALCNRNNTNSNNNTSESYIEMITRGIGFSAFTPFITYIPEIFSYDVDGSEDFLILVGPAILDLVEPATLAVLVEQELYSRAETAQTVTKEIAFDVANSIIERLSAYISGRDLTLIIIFFA